MCASICPDRSRKKRDEQHRYQEPRQRHTKREIPLSENINGVLQHLLKHILPILLQLGVASVVRNDLKLVRPLSPASELVFNPLIIVIGVIDEPFPDVNAEVKHL